MATKTLLLPKSGSSNILRPGHHYQKFKFHQQQEALAAHFDLTSFSAQPFFRFLTATFLHQGSFGWNYTYSRGKMLGCIPVVLFDALYSYYKFLLPQR